MPTKCSILDSKDPDFVQTWDIYINSKQVRKISGIFIMVPVWVLVHPGGPSRKVAGVPLVNIPPPMVNIPLQCCLLRIGLLSAWWKLKRRGYHKYLSVFSVFTHFICGFLSFKWVARKPGKPNHPPFLPCSLPPFPLPTSECTAFRFESRLSYWKIRKALGGGGAEIILLFLFAFFFVFKCTGRSPPIIGNLIKKRVVSGVRDNEIIIISSLIRPSVHPSSTHTHTHTRQLRGRLHVVHSLSIVSILRRVLHPCQCFLF